MFDLFSFESYSYGQLSHYPISPLESVMWLMSGPQKSVSPRLCVRMKAPLLCWLLLLTMASVQGSEEAMTELKQNIFYRYDNNVIPQEVSGDLHG